MVDSIDTTQDAPDQTSLIQTIYEVAVDPHVYDRLVDLWGQHLLATLGDNPLQEEGTTGPSSEIAEHLLRSFEILDRLGRQEQPSPTPTQERAEIRISRRGEIISCSPLASEVLGAHPGDALLDLAVSAETATRLSQEISGKETGYPGEVFVFFAKGDKHPYPMVRELSGDTDGSGAGGFVLAGLHNRWTEAHDQILRQMFGLTAAETRVARELLTGANLRDIAETTGRSVDTLRTQLKAIRRKTYTANQQQLVRIMTGLEALIKTGSPETQNAAGSEHVFILQDGRKMAYRIFGPERGTACLFIHNMLNGPNFPPEVIQEMQNLGLRFICPVRPGFGTSDMDPVSKKTPAEAPDRFCADMLPFLEHLGCSKLLAIGHMSGALFAFRLAQLHPELVQGVFNISGAVPITEMAQIRAMHYRQQVMAMTARFTPRMLPTLLRAGIAQIDAGGVEGFLNALYRPGTPDRALAERPEHRDTLFKGFRQIVQQGHWSFAIDSHHVVRDWSDFCSNLTQPVTLVYGEADPVVTPVSVQKFATRMGFNSHCYSGVGQLVLYQEPTDVLQRIASMARANFR
ncbi:alpha/beta hydrolase [Pseudophaeobacter sp.]|uniref:alpha/beta hydrolase n=1 Tax=Pseudophaeobacter sp. TaxID=1971739 RepID=UPI0032972635